MSTTCSFSQLTSQTMSSAVRWRKQDQVDDDNLTYTVEGTFDSRFLEQEIQLMKERGL